MSTAAAAAAAEALSHGALGSLPHVLFLFSQGSDKVPSSLPNVGCFLDACRKRDSVSPCALLAICILLKLARQAVALLSTPSFDNYSGSVNMAPGTELGKGFLRPVQGPSLMRVCCSVPVCVERRGLDLCFRVINYPPVSCEFPELAISQTHLRTCLPSLQSSRRLVFVSFDS